MVFSYFITVFKWEKLEVLLQLLGILITCSHISSSVHLLYWLFPNKFHGCPELNDYQIPDENLKMQCIRHYNMSSLLYGGLMHMIILLLLMIIYRWWWLHKKVKVHYLYISPECSMILNFGKLTYSRLKITWLFAWKGNNEKSSFDTVNVYMQVMQVFKVNEPWLMLNDWEISMELSCANANKPAFQIPLTFYQSTPLNKPKYKHLLKLI